jgi:hypothetical protein
MSNLNGPYFLFFLQQPLDLTKYIFLETPLKISEDGWQKIWQQEHRLIQSHGQKEVEVHINCSGLN